MNALERKKIDKITKGAYSTFFASGSISANWLYTRDGPLKTVSRPLGLKFRGIQSHETYNKLVTLGQ